MRMCYARNVIVAGSIKHSGGVLIENAIVIWADFKLEENTKFESSIFGYLDWNCSIYHVWLIS